MPEEAKSMASIRGRIFNESGNPIGGINVLVDSSETRTLFNGTYSFTGLSLGIHTIGITVNGYRRVTKKIELKENESAVADFYLERDSGDAKIFGYVLDHETRDPIKQGGSVYLYLPVENLRTSINPKTGYFEFSSINQGTYNIWTSVLDYDEKKKTINLGEKEEKREDFHIKKKSDVEPQWG